MNAADFIAMAEDILRHPRFVKDGSVLFDHRKLEFGLVTFEDLQKIRMFHTAHEEKIGAGKSAILVARGLSGAWHTLWSQGEKIKTANKSQVFDDYRQAVAWAGEAP